MDISVESLDTPALTKAQLADMLFEHIGLNNRESKDMVEAFFALVQIVWWKAMTSKFPGSATSKYVQKHLAPGEIRERVKPSP